jgi:hypothetical protein
MGVSMATQAFIIRAEDNLAHLTDAEIDEVIEAFEAEGRHTGHGRPYRENRDYWGTLWMNAMRLQPKNPGLDRLIKTLNREFKR